MATVTSSLSLLLPVPSDGGVTTLRAGLWAPCLGENQCTLKQDDSTIILEGH